MKTKKKERILHFSKKTIIELNNEKLIKIFGGVGGENGDGNGDTRPTEESGIANSGLLCKPDD
ncbi:hypothetical protein N7U66_10010 [Lacinutrix neustonica]|uniref:Uncharacterized protein n=1 Tax=Lacinutrix neustonica TaxID=2980107 RepID=A0A9E8SFR8_9FLAO|nr:hypothetical protein [Lacinutrix neustonica]WAC03724.1 hypothetical protein N7U66_10010 [Lacinutrix neustonica]